MPSTRISLLMALTYKIGFTRTALLTETVAVAQLYANSGDWQRVEAEIASANPFQARAKRSSTIIYGEIQKRLSLLNSEQIQAVADNYPQDVRQLVWICICKQYPFVADFVAEVAVPAYLNGRADIGYDDYGYFFNKKADWHPELDQVSDKTRSNARQALFQMMRQCELISSDDQFIPQMISVTLQNCTPDAELALIPGAILL